MVVHALACAWFGVGEALSSDSQAMSEPVCSKWRGRRDSIVRLVGGQTIRLQLQAAKGSGDGCRQVTSWTVRNDVHEQPALVQYIHAMQWIIQPPSPAPWQRKTGKHAPRL